MTTTPLRRLALILLHLVATLALYAAGVGIAVAVGVETDEGEHWALGIPFGAALPCVGALTCLTYKWIRYGRL
ncbi:hypothetical protein ACFY7C_19425 [Streptomyces sp. NPDC012769]|uniref:hypothetical protein n=1 Tax=Streptomyces sp. NPDC012769 TaxID=3364848 RepID=UPI0036C21DB6